MKSKYLMRRCVALAGIGIAAQAAFGVEFKKVGGDISSATDWGSTSFNSSSYIDFVSSGTYYASADVGCRLFRLKNANDVLVDASANNPTITINQQSGDQSIILLPKDNAAITFKGGVWNAGGGTAAYLRCCSAVDSGQAATNRSISIVGGAVVTNVVGVYCAGGNNSSAARLMYNCFNNLLISGAGTRLYTTNMYCAYSYTDGSVQTNNAITISDGAVVTLYGPCFTDSKLAAVGSGTLSGNLIRVSDATLKVLSNIARPVLVGSTPGSRGNRFILSGPNAVLDVKPVSEFDFFAGSDVDTSGNEVSIENGATFLKASTSFALFQYTHGNTLRVSGGARFGLADTSVANFITIGRWEASSSNNTVIVEDGGSLEANYIRVTCRENSLVVSNATVTCAGDGASVNESNACTIGYYHANNSPTNGVTGNRLVMRGSTPALRAPNGRVMFRYYSHCDFKVPTEGYAAGHVPIVAKSFEIKTGCFLSAALDGYLEKGKSATYTLVETTDGVTLGSGVLDAANATLGDLGRFSLSDDGKKLLLYAKGQSGITVIFR